MWCAEKKSLVQQQRRKSGNKVRYYYKRKPKSCAYIRYTNIHSGIYKVGSQKMRRQNFSIQTLYFLVFIIITREKVVLLFCTLSTLLPSYPNIYIDVHRYMLQRMQLYICRIWAKYMKDKRMYFHCQWYNRPGKP